MKKLLFGLLLVGGVLLFLQLDAGADWLTDFKKTKTKKAVWLTDFKQAEAKAKKEDKLILVDFSGSDWCGWCIRLDKEVFSKDKFKKFAKKNLILLLIDFPSRKKQSSSVKRNNRKLAEKYKVSGYPTILLLDKKGKVVAKTGYQKGGATNYVKHLKKLMGKKYLK